MLYLHQMFALGATAVLLIFSVLEKASCIVCKCDYHCPDDHQNFTCHTNGKCFTQIKEDENFDLQTTRGCLNNDENGGNFQCNAKRHSKPAMLLCCNDLDLCNVNLYPTLSPETLLLNQNNQKYNQNHRNDMYAKTHNIALVVSITVCTVLLVIVFTYFFFRHRQLKIKRKYDSERQIIIHEGTLPVNSLTELLGSDILSDKSSGVPVLMQRTIAMQVNFQFIIGCGYFGDVWKARWCGEDVAVKVFNLKDESIWYREAELYQTVLLRHEHILGFVAADVRQSDQVYQFLLITAYHKHGSLHDFLQSHTYDQSIMIRLTHSLVSGLAYLHREVCGMKGKVAVAHRNLKPQNILIKDNLTCTIGGLSHAVTSLQLSEKVNKDIYDCPSSVRYMAPELVNDTFNALHFDSHKHADMYSMSLIYWSILRRCETEGFSDDFQLPYTVHVPINPTSKDMEEVIVEQMIRPEIPKRWSIDKDMQFLVKIMSECWSHSPVARLTALRVKKNLQKYFLSDDNMTDQLISESNSS